MPCAPSSRHAPRWAYPERVRLLLATSALIVVTLVLAVADARAQMPGDGPLLLADGRVSITGEVTATASTKAADDEGWFNYSSYELSTLRNVRLALAADARLTQRLSIVAEVRTDSFEHVDAYALFLRMRPWAGRAIDVHLGRVPPTFGAYARRPYSVDNPVVGMPLAYQYLTSLRADAVPRTADDLATMRGRGWQSSFPVGNPEPAAGLPLVNALRWDTGAQVRAAAGPIVALGAVTVGTLSNPRVRDDNRGAQVAGRITYTPHAAVTLGLSAARGAYLSDDLARVLSPAVAGGRRYAQRALGADAEVSRGRWIARAEWIRASWDVPVVANPALPPALSAWSGFVEGRYRVAPGWDVAARVDRLAFGRITTSAGQVPWDGEVDRVEVAVGWALRRGLRLKGAWQVNTRDAGRVRVSRVGALQCIAWF